MTHISISQKDNSIFQLKDQLKIYLPKHSSTILSDSDWLRFRTNTLNLIKRTKSPEMKVFESTSKIRDVGCVENYLKDIHELNVHETFSRRPVLQDMKQDQFSFLKNEDVKFLGFVGTDASCEFQVPESHNSKAGAVGQYDSIVYQHGDQIMMKRLHGAPELRKESLYNHDMYLKTSNLEKVKEHYHPLIHMATHYKQTPLVKRPGRKAVNMLSAIDGANFEIRLPAADEFANLNKESVSNVPHGLVESVGLPLAQLGIIGVFYPFISMGADVLQHEYDHTQHHLKNLDTRHSETLHQLSTLSSPLRLIDSSIESRLTEFLALNSKSHTMSFKKMKKQAQSLAEETVKTLYRNIDYLNDRQKSQLLKLLHGLNHFVEIRAKQQSLKFEKKEFWFDKNGLKGMLTALKVFVAYGVISLAKYAVTAEETEKYLSTATDVLDGAGLGTMGISQLMVMISGIIKMTSGIIQYKQNLSVRQKMENIANVIDHDSASDALKKYSLLQKKQVLTEVLSKSLPGLSLTIGQGAMAAWSIASIGFLASGVGAPAGVAMMLGLLVPGVTFTLLASAPKIGLASLFSKKFKHEYAQDTHFHKHNIMHLKMKKYASEGTTDTQSLLTKIADDYTQEQSKVDQIQALKEAPLPASVKFRKLQNILKIDSNSSLLNVIDTLEENNLSHVFLERMYNRHKNRIDIFKRENHSRLKTVRPVKITNFYKPRVLWRSRLHYMNGEYRKTKKLVFINHQKVHSLQDPDQIELMYENAFKLLSTQSLERTRTVRESLGEMLFTVASSQI